MLVDAGLSMEKIENGLAAADVAPESLRGIVITHTHGDHLGCAVKMSRHHKLKIFASDSAARANAVLARAKRLETFAPGATLTIGPFEVDTIAISHDAPGTVACMIRAENKQFGIATDLGRTCAALERALAACDAFLIEFNHDEAMLRDGMYPWRLKRRVLSEEGHISNDQAAAILSKCVSPRTRHVLLAHLSEKNNNPTLALESARGVLEKSGIVNIKVEAAPRAEPGAAVEV